ncbi:hypothetical protein KDL29_10445 [bacterium]|nr:hypothetical protein [bacterium]UNM07965.1 MAG: hypothetical protein H7A35_14065 [Planctomycetales bacterium]
MRNWGIRLLAAAMISLTCISGAFAAPDRFDNQIPDAVPDPENTSSISYSLYNIDTDGPVTSERTSHQMLRFGYQFSEKLNASFHVNMHDLSGGIGLTNPIFSSLDSAKSYGLRLEMNLLNEPAKEAGPDNQPPWTPGSAFMIGFMGNLYDLDRSGVGENETELGAFLAYSTDLTEEMRGHTYFSTSRLTGDNASGSLNRVGAGLDYLLQEGDRPLVLMANGMIDIYNFRQPNFNTSRISRFDLGLRYTMSRQWDAQLGWSTFNDSEQDSSGSGLFAGINWRNLKDPCHCGSCTTCTNGQPKPAAEAGGEQPPAQASVDRQQVENAARLAWDPQDTPMMALSYPENYDNTAVEDDLLGKRKPADELPLRTTASAMIEPTESILPEHVPVAGKEVASADAALQADNASEVQLDGNGGGEGIDIPVFPDSQPRLEARADLMVRPTSTARTLPEDSIINDISEVRTGSEPAPEEFSQFPEEQPAETTEGLQGFVPLATPLDAVLSRAPGREIEVQAGDDGIADACSRFLYLRLASVPRRLLARGN